MSAAVARIALVKKPVLRGPGLAKRQPQQPDAQPFLKWVGGKGRLLSQLTPLLPEGVERMRHLEPFMGGGALFFARAPRRAILSDINPALVGTYLAVRDDLPSVVRHLRGLKKRHSKEEFYHVRERYNAGRMGDARRAATFIYLNKTCFNGLHRVNKKGKFNVPCGRYTNPRILDLEGLTAASEALQKTTIVCDGFDGLLRRARKGDFVYLDPPYAPVSATSSFTSYASDGFGAEEQRRLRDVYEALDDRGCKLMLSNSDVGFIRELYAKWRIDIVRAPRAINSNASRRGKVNEVVVRNY
ncbi:MAG: DNA adenine methylase [Myxococcota bacterium]